MHRARFCFSDRGPFALAWILCAAVVQAADIPAADQPVILAGPVLQCPSETSTRVTWITDRNTTGAVEWGRTDERELRTARTSRHGLIEANRRLHSVVLEGLEPGQEYRFRVISREIRNFAPYKVQFGNALTNGFSRFRSFDRKADRFSFLVFNDLHDNIRTIPELLAVAGPAPYDFVVMNGDIVSHSDDERPVLAVLDQAARSFASRVPMIWVRGNHETRGNFARHLPDYMGTPEGRYYYAFDHGPVHFIVLDAGEDKKDTSPEYSGLVDFAAYRREQKAWLNNHVNTREFRHARFRIVISHMPFASKSAAGHAGLSSEFTGMADAFQEFGPTLEKAGIDLMLSGHMHLAAVIPPEPPRHSYPIIQGGGNRGQGRTIIRVNVTKEGLEALVLRPDGSQALNCKIPAR